MTRNGSNFGIKIEVVWLINVVLHRLIRHKDYSSLVLAKQMPTPDIGDSAITGNFQYWWCSNGFTSSGSNNPLSEHRVVWMQHVSDRKMAEIYLARNMMLQIPTYRISKVRV